MAIIINDPKNLPVTIACTTVENFEKAGLSEDFIKSLVAPQNNKIGKETDNYYILGVNVRIITNKKEYFDSIYLLAELLDYCRFRGFNLIMIKKKTNV